MTTAQATSMCTAAQQLTAAGMTIVVSSGDSGVGGQSGETCPAFVPTYPGGCQYILSVGATQAFSPEVMVDTSLAGFYSGAGFSKIFTTPSYQTSVVAAYESALGSTDNGYYTKTGRAFPDVSAQGSLQNVVASGSVELGTSPLPHTPNCLDDRMLILIFSSSWRHLLLRPHRRLRSYPPQRSPHQGRQGYHRLGQPHLLRQPQCLHRRYFRWIVRLRFDQLRSSCQVWLGRLCWSWNTQVRFPPYRLRCLSLGCSSIAGLLGLYSTCRDHYFCRYAPVL